METTNVKRRLTSILAADAVGFSHQTSLDEEGTLRVLAAHRAVIDGIIAFHEGRIVGTAGDSVLAEFASPVEAVRCAVEIQEALKTRNDSLPEEKRLQFRVGVNLGDVVVKDKDLLGDGVNVASRLEGIAEPGGVCISSSVYDQITGKLNLGFQDIGEQALKNISRPIRAYRLAGTGAPVRPAVRPHGSGSRGAWVAGAAIGAAVILGVMAWQGGWFGVGVSKDDTALMAARTAEEARLKAAAEEAAALRAKLEEETQRARGDAEVLKRAAEAELARARAEADASRSARIKADAEAAALRVKEEANALKRAAETEMAKAAQARKDAELAEAAARAKATPAQAAAAQPAPKTSSGRTTAYDGQWRVTRACEAYQELPPITDEFVVPIRGSILEIERGKRGQPGYWFLRGTVADDGMLTLTGTGVSRAKRSAGQETHAHFSGSLRGEAPVLTGSFGRRKCTFALARAN